MAIQDRFAMSSEELPMILVVDDVEPEGQALCELLESRGYQVVFASDAQTAIIEAQKSGVSVVLMDIRLGGPMDGIDLARKLQLDHPFMSFIFVSGHLPNEGYRQRAREAGLRVGAWLDKPLTRQIGQIAKLIDREYEKLCIVVEAAKDLREFLMELVEPRVSPDLLEELRRDPLLSGLLDSGPTWAEPRSTSPKEEPPKEEFLDALSTRVDNLYDEILSLMEAHRDDPELSTLLAPLQSQLTKLEEEEADLFFSRIRVIPKFDPEAAERLIEETRRRLRES